MALWKPFRGKRADLDTVEKHDGWVYFTTDDARLFFDYEDADGNLQRKQISAKDAETLAGMTLDEIKEYVQSQSIELAPDLATEGMAADAKLTGDAIGVKLDKNLGIEASGKILSVDENGDIIAIDNTSGGQITVDDALSTESTNPVQNKVVTESLNALEGGMSAMADALDGLLSNQTSVDTELSDTSENAVQNKVVTVAINEAKEDAIARDIVVLREAQAYTDAALGGAGSSMSVDSELSTTSENPVQNKVITTQFNAALADIEQAITTLNTAMNSATATPASVDMSGYSSGTIVETFADGSTKTTTIEFDANGNPTKITDGDGRVTTYVW